MSYYNYKPEKNIVADYVVKTVADVLFAVSFALLICIFFCNTATVSGTSMYPTLENDNTCLIDVLSYDISSPNRYDVIAFKSDDALGYTFKRVYGLPGETVKIEGNTIYITTISGDVVEASTEYFNDYEGDITAGLAASGVTLSEDEYFVLGDNLSLSEDSRFSSVGNVNIDDIYGKAWMIISPFSDLAIVK